MRVLFPYCMLVVGISLACVTFAGQYSASEDAPAELAAVFSNNKCDSFLPAEEASTAVTLLEPVGKPGPSLRTWRLDTLDQSGRKILSHNCTQKK